MQYFIFWIYMNFLLLDVEHSTINRVVVILNILTRNEAFIVSSHPPFLTDGILFNVNARVHWSFLSVVEVITESFLFDVHNVVMVATRGLYYHYVYVVIGLHTSMLDNLVFIVCSCYIWNFLAYSTDTFVSLFKSLHLYKVDSLCQLLFVWLSIILFLKQ